MTTEHRSAPLILVNPPLLKYDAAPPLGLVHLVGAGRAAGFAVELFDANAAVLERLGSGTCGRPSVVSGDHPSSRVDLDTVQRAYWGEIAATSGLDLPPGRLAAVQLPPQDLPRLHTAVTPELDILLSRPIPRVVGLSVTVPAQLVWSLAACARLRAAGSGVQVVLGGAYVTALTRLDDPATTDILTRSADTIVCGPAEGTFVDILRRAAAREPLPRGLVMGVTGKRPVPWSDGATWTQVAGPYVREGMVVPVQTARGCPYGRCRYCSYPLVEPRYECLPLAETLGPALDFASQVGGRISIKDSDVPHRRLRQIAQIIAGRVPWAACTRLSDAARPGLIEALARAGLETLEIGFESADVAVLEAIDKGQRPDDLFAVCAAAERAGIGLILNSMLGLPGQTELSGWLQQSLLHDGLRRRFPRLRYHVETHGLQVQRGTPLASAAADAGSGQPVRYPLSVVLEENTPPAWVAECLAAFREPAGSVQPAARA